MVQEVLELAMTLGKLEESQGLKALCEAAVEALTGELREGVSPEDCGAAFVLGAAWLALAGMETGRDGVESFTAGAVSIRTGGSGEREKALRLQARQVMKPFLRDEGFIFRGVRGG